MKKNPQISVSINKNLDKQVCLQFLNFQKAGVNFGDTIVFTHPDLKLARNEVNLNKRGVLVDNYVNAFYKKYNQSLVHEVDVFKEEWDKKQRKFYELLPKFFGNCEWPDGEYVAYLSIFNCNPRFLENKTFQVYWKHPKGFISVSFHEMLHFLFYFTLEKFFPLMNINSEEVWEMSEIVNFLILSDQKFLNINKNSYPDLYPQLQEKINEYRKIWSSSNQSVEKFVKQALVSR